MRKIVSIVASALVVMTALLLSLVVLDLYSFDEVSDVAVKLGGLAVIAVVSGAIIGFISQHSHDE